MSAEQPPPLPVKPPPEPTPCSVRGCTAVAEFFPGVREKGRNQIGMFWRLPLCRGCSASRTIHDLADASTFPAIRECLKKAGQWVSKLEDVEVVRVYINDPDAAVFKRQPDEGKG